LPLELARRTTNDPYRERFVALFAQAGYTSLMGTAKVPDQDLGVGRYVRLRRKANDLNQQQLAELAGVGKRFLVELEAGKPTLRMDAVNKVLAVFGKVLGVVDRTRDHLPDPNEDIHG
jgi:y4mF family transcriptional regulator